MPTPSVQATLPIPKAGTHPTTPLMTKTRRHRAAADYPREMSSRHLCQLLRVIDTSMTSPSGNSTQLSPIAARSFDQMSHILCFSDLASQLVKKLTINWEDVYLKDEIPNQGLFKAMVRYGTLPAVLNRRLFRDRFALLRTVLGRTTNLTSLTLIVSGRDSQSDVYAADVLSLASFSLTYFKTTFVVGPHVTAFIEHQQDLKELCLTSESRMLEGVALPEGACPRLERFSWTWGTGDQLELAVRVIKSRPMRHVGAVLSARNAIEGVDMISQAAPQLDSAVFTLRDFMPKNFLPHVSSRLPHLIHLKLSLARLPPKVLCLLHIVSSSNSHIIALVPTGNLDGIGQFLLTPFGLRLSPCVSWSGA
ncbi:hypothetical protein IMY05_C4769000300 [Salix suchowensis]|nr:hypothetical protein IMY05_C4769000300 [Salix suchowensis]